MYGNGIGIVEVGIYALGVTGTALVLAVIASLKEAAYLFKQWWWNLTAQRHLDDTVREAYELDALREDVEALYRKVHYRHNIHCPVCGRFAKRVEGFPDGVSDCKVHGVRMRTVEYTGMIDVEIRMVNRATVPPPTPTPAELKAEEFPEIVVDYHDDDFVPDQFGLPVFTQPLAIEEAR
jgi:hypothetical protein